MTYNQLAKNAKSPTRPIKHVYLVLLSNGHHGRYICIYSFELKITLEQGYSYEHGCGNGFVLAKIVNVRTITVKVGTLSFTALRFVSLSIDSNAQTFVCFSCYCLS